MISHFANVLSLFVVLAPAGATGSSERLCFSREETRERIHADKLADPFAIVRSMASSLGADALGAKLCRTNGTLVYEISLLARDGRVIHATVDAATGRLR